jgi:hypothetical protein
VQQRCSPFKVKGGGENAKVPVGMIMDRSPPIAALAWDTLNLKLNPPTT